MAHVSVHREQIHSAHRFRWLTIAWGHIWAKGVVNRVLGTGTKTSITELSENALQRTWSANSVSHILIIRSKILTIYASRTGKRQTDRETDRLTRQRDRQRNRLTRQRDRLTDKTERQTDCDKERQWDGDRRDTHRDWDREKNSQRKRSVLMVRGPSTIKILPVLSISGPSTIKILPVLSMRGPSIIKILPILTMSGPSTTHRGDNYKASLLSNTPRSSIHASTSTEIIRP